MSQDFLRGANIATKKAELATNGYVVIPSICDSGLLSTLLKTLYETLEHCAQEIGCSREDYLTAVSRWASPSPITHVYEETFLQTISLYVEKFIGPCVLEKTNVISKTKYANKAVPFHQDISYSPENPYEITAWLALTDVPMCSGPLVFIKGSHLDVPQPAVDFWSPNFVDKRKLRSSKKNILVPLKAGDLVVFDSRVWHGSLENEIGYNRFALATRWKGVEYKAPEDIPPIEKSAFGMWTCQQITQQILHEGLNLWRGRSESSFDEIISVWLEILDQGEFDFPLVRDKAKRSLKSLRILHHGHALHNGGDSQGAVYSDVWHDLLTPLKQTMSP